MYVFFREKEKQRLFIVYRMQLSHLEKWRIFTRVCKEQTDKGEIHHSCPKKGQCFILPKTLKLERNNLKNYKKHFAGIELQRPVTSNSIASFNLSPYESVPGFIL